MHNENPITFGIFQNIYHTCNSLKKLETWAWGTSAAHRVLAFQVAERGSITSIPFGSLSPEHYLYTAECGRRSNIMRNLFSTEDGEASMLQMPRIKTSNRTIDAQH